MPAVKRALDLELLKPDADAPELVRVSELVNSTKNDSAECVAPIPT